MTTEDGSRGMIVPQQIRNGICMRTDGMPRPVTVRTCRRLMAVQIEGGRLCLPIFLQPSGLKMDHLTAAHQHSQVHSLIVAISGPVKDHERPPQLCPERNKDSHLRAAITRSQLCPARTAIEAISSMTSTTTVLNVMKASTICVSPATGPVKVVKTGSVSGIAYLPSSIDPIPTKRQSPLTYWLRDDTVNEDPIDSRQTTMLIRERDWTKDSSAKDVSHSPTRVIGIATPASTAPGATATAASSGVVTALIHSKQSPTKQARGMTTMAPDNTRCIWSEATIYILLPCLQTTPHQARCSMRLKVRCPIYQTLKITPQSV